jgi:hypothetical protein
MWKEVIKFVSIVCILGITPSFAGTPSKGDKTKVIQGGFQTPESMLHDVATDTYLVANINGNPFAKDGNGFISKISPDGTISNLKWIDGAAKGVTLHAPKGMGIHDGILYVTDIDHVRKFDAKTGAPKGAIHMHSASFLNDIAVGPDGTIYVSDSGLAPGFKPSGTDAIYAIDSSGTVRAIAKNKDLGKPNGLWVDKDGVWVVSFGSGEIYRIGADGKKAEAVKLPKGSLDGIVALGNGDVLITSWAAKGIYRGKKGGPFTLMFTGLEAPADPGLDRKRGRLLVPLFNKNELHILNVQ